MFRLKLLILLGLFFPVAISGKSRQTLFINEVMTNNVSNYVDDFGERSAWIEIFNATYAPVDLGGMYLTNDLKNPKKYRIPLGSPKTVIQPRDYCVLFANNKTAHGVLYTNFDLKGATTIALYASDGKTLIDMIQLPENFPADLSYGRKEDGGNELGFLEATTPKASNVIIPKPTSAEKFGQFDPFGVAMAFIAMSTVFLSLALLSLIFRHITRVYNFDLRTLLSRRKAQETMQKMPEEEFPGEVAAAIALALHLYQQQIHDNEATVLTIQRVSRLYSPWSSKIYGLRQFPK